jgi:two-component sensor histidine kinase
MNLGLLATELVANAVMHGLPNIRLEAFEVGAFHVRVEVSNGSRALPEMCDCSVDSTSGRGLQLIDAVALKWGFITLLTGKVVWCELTDSAPRPVGATPVSP